MYKFSNFHVFLVMLITGDIVLITSHNFPTPSTDLNPANSLLPIPQIKPVLFPKSIIPPCKGEEDSFFFTESINGIQNTRLFEVTNPDPSLAPCEDNTLLLAEMIGICPETCEKCDLSYVVLIQSKRKGGMVVTGQGIRLRDGSIITAYYATQLGEEGIWVKYPDDCIAEVTCMKKLKSQNLLSEFVYTVQLEVNDANCCNSIIDYDFCEPEFITSTDFPLVPGYLVTQSNSSPSFTDYSISPMFGHYVDDPTDVAASIVIPDKPSRIGPGYQGAVFIIEDCKVLGIAVAKPSAASNRLFSVPLAQEIEPGCVLIIIPIKV